MANAIPAIVGAIGPTVGKAAGALNDAGQFNAETSATVPIVPQATGEAANAAANALPGLQKEAIAGQERAAQTEKNILVPGGAAAAGAGGALVGGGAALLKEAVTQYQQLINTVNQKQLDAEKALQHAQSISDIDPDRYRETMGVSGRTISAIGMLVSGIGAGLTGQPNMAMQVFQRNIDRDIEAQKQSFLDRMTAAAQAEGLLKTAQDRQQLAIAAQQAATISINAGISGILQGIQTQAAGATAPDLVKALNFKVSQDLLNSMGQYNRDYIQMSKSGNSKQLKMSGLAADKFKEKMTGEGLDLNPRPLEHAREQGNPNPAMSTNKNEAQPPATDTGNPQPTSPARIKQPTFLDALSDAFSKKKP